MTGVGGGGELSWLDEQTRPRAILGADTPWEPSGIRYFPARRLAVRHFAANVRKPAATCRSILFIITESRH